MKEFSNELLQAVKMMGISARTAPKANGLDFLEIKVLNEEETVKLGKAMKEYGLSSGKRNFERDGENVMNSQAGLLISINGEKHAGLNCGACGYNSCSELLNHEGIEFDGPICAWRLIDLGIALGSAVKTASIFNLDNRIMYRAGVVAKSTGIIAGEIVVGVPVSCSGKNIYFDRK